MNMLFKILLFISSYIPLWIMIFIQNMSDVSFEQMCVVFQKNPLLWGSIVVLSVCSYAALILWINRMKKEYDSSNSLKTKLIGISSRDGDLLNYFITFLFPMITLDIMSTPSIIVNTILLFIEGLYFVRNDTLHYNVMLTLHGYRIYSDNDDNIIISKKKRADIINKQLDADQIGTSSIYYI